MRYFNVLAAAVAALITLPVQAQDLSRSNMAMKSTGFGNSAPVKPETGCPLMLWEHKNRSVITHDMIQLTRDARQIRQIMWNGQGYRIVFGPGAFQDGDFRTKVEKPLGIISFGCVDGGIAELTVTDCADGRPLADASVNMGVPTLPQLARDLRTDAAGRVPLICNVCSLPETTDLTVGKTGYVEQKDKLRFVGQVIERPVVCLTAAGAVAAPQPAKPKPQLAAPNVVAPPAQIPDGFARKRSATDKATGHAYASSAGSSGWTEAERLCREQGGHLATITSQRENNFLVNTFNTDRRLWLGGTDSPQEDQWQWITGESWRFTNWNPDEPNDSSPGEDYLQFDFGGSWNDDGLPKTDAHFGFLCEWEPNGLPDIGATQKQRASDPVPAPLATTRPTKAPSDASVNPATGHAYRRSDNRTTWAAALRGCQAQGAHLATITSRAENDFVAAHFNGSERIWLGGSDAMQEGQWQWVTGEPFSFRGFGPDEPNDNGSGEDYLELGDNGEWNDDGMPKRDREFFFLCEWEPREKGS